MANPRRQAGVLARHVEGYRAWLARHGYTTQTIRNMLKDLGQVGLWLSGQGLDARDLDEWITPGTLEALIPGRMQGHGGTEEVPR
jgi:hypothetical protein